MKKTKTLRNKKSIFNFWAVTEAHTSSVAPLLPEMVNERKVVQLEVKLETPFSLAGLAVRFEGNIFSDQGNAKRYSYGNNFGLLPLQSMQRPSLSVRLMLC